MSQHLDPRDLAACRLLLRQGSKSFFAASLLLPRHVREPATALYAFCRVADDAVDLSSNPADAVDGLRLRLDQIYAGEPRDDCVDRALSAVVEQFALPRAHLDALLEGFLWDIESRRYANIAALRAYGARVAGTVGVMMTLLMGERSPAALARACDLGIAMQLTNIARDVGEDARNGRLYLPADWLAETGIDSEAWLADPRPDPRIAAVVARLLAEGAALYTRSRDGIALLPSDCRPAINAARLIYSEIGEEVARAGHDSVSRRAFVPGKRKLRLLVEAVLADSRSSGKPHNLLEEARFLIEAVPPRSQTIAASRAARILTIFEKAERKKIEAWAITRPA